MAHVDGVLTGGQGLQVVSETVFLGSIHTSLRSFLVRPLPSYDLQCVIPVVGSTAIEHLWVCDGGPVGPSFGGTGSAMVSVSSTFER